MRRRFATLDVFTDRRFTGNPLAVVLDPDGLDGVTMQAVAREFNHPETVFVFAPENPAHRARLRIFTPARELPFAGHPTVGTAVLLALRDGGGAGREFALEEPIGPVRCVLEAGAGERGTARFIVPQLPAEVGPAPDATALAAGLALSPQEIGFDGWRPSRWTAGNPFTFVPAAGPGGIGPLPPRRRQVRGGLRRGRRCFRLLRRNDRARPSIPRPHVRARHGHSRRSGDRLGRGGVCRRDRRRASPTGAMRSPSSRATRWAGQA
jgi:trans-2,3-dihydro-3-hydroxyanthranilate isomerase